MPRAVMPAAGDEEQCAFRLIGGLCEVARQRDENRETITIVPGRIEPAIGMRVDDQHLAVTTAAHHADRVVALEGVEHFRL